MSTEVPLLNPRRSTRATGRDARSADSTPLEKRFYTTTPRFEETVQRVCGRSVVVFRADTGDILVRGLEDVERDYESARADSASQQRPVADLEARFGAAIVRVHLQVLTKISELEELAQTGTSTTDVRRLANNLLPLCRKLADIEARASVATTGDLNEEERLRVKFFSTERVCRAADAVQLRREAQAAAKRHGEGKSAGDAALVERASIRANEIRSAAQKLRAKADISREVALDRVLKQVDQILTTIPKMRADLNRQDATRRHRGEEG